MLAYDGAAFHGWQRQPALPTVQGVLLEAARGLLGEDTRLTGASRTDAGVHALRQTASVTTRSDLPPPAVRAALNAALPAAIRILEAADAGAGFNARRAAAGKRYAYLIDNGPVPLPLLARCAWHVSVPLDVASMRAALASLRGRHDFSAFCAAPGRATDPTCTVRAVHVRERKRRLAILISADRFLHHMARNIVGSLVEVGRGAQAPAWVGQVLRGRDRRQAGPTAPAHGLVLVRVLYPR